MNLRRVIACTSLIVGCGGAPASPERAVPSSVAAVPASSALAAPPTTPTGDAGTGASSSGRTPEGETVTSVYARVPSVRGSADDARAASDVERALKRARESFESCASRGRFIGSQTLAVRLVSGEDRRVLELSTKWKPMTMLDAPPASAITECLERELRSLEWPRPKQDAPVPRATGTPSTRSGQPAVDVGALRVLAGDGVEGARVDFELRVDGHEKGSAAAAGRGSGP